LAEAACLDAIAARARRERRSRRDTRPRRGVPGCNERYVGRQATESPCRDRDLGRRRTVRAGGGAYGSRDAERTLRTAFRTAGGDCTAAGRSSQGRIRVAARERRWSRVVGGTSR